MQSTDNFNMNILPSGKTNVVDDFFIIRTSRSGLRTASECIVLNCLLGPLIHICLWDNIWQRQSFINSSNGFSEVWGMYMTIYKISMKEKKNTSQCILLPHKLWRNQSRGGNRRFIWLIGAHDQCNGRLYSVPSYLCSFGHDWRV